MGNRRIIERSTNITPEEVDPETKKLRTIAAARMNAINLRCKLAHPERVEANKREHRKGGEFYAKTLVYQRTGLQGKRNKIRMRHGREWRKYKQIIAPQSQIHHEWVSGTAGYRGVALVEADQHMHGIIDVIRILDGEINLFTEREIADRGEI